MSGKNSVGLLEAGKITNLEECRWLRVGGKVPTGLRPGDIVTRLIVATTSI